MCTGGDSAPVPAPSTPTAGAAAVVERCVSSLYLGRIQSGLLRWRHDNKPTADPPEVAAHLSVSAFKNHGEGSVADQVVAAELEPPNRLHVAAAGGTLVQGDAARRCCARPSGAAAGGSGTGAGVAAGVSGVSSTDRGLPSCQAAALLAHVHWALAAARGASHGCIAISWSSC